MSATISITVAVENTAPLGGRGLLAEHGLAFWVASAGRKILFDTGQGLALMNNAERLHLDLDALDTVVLSHGHYDHAGGLKPLLERRHPFQLVAHPAVFEEKLAVSGDRMRSIGMPVSRADLEDAGIRLQLSDRPAAVAENAVTTGEIPQMNDFERIEPIFQRRLPQGMAADPLADDQALLLITEKGLVVLLGCTHRGLINTLQAAVRILGPRPIRAVMGGLHLAGALDAQLAWTCEQLKDYDIQRFYIGHCTGQPAIMTLAAAFPGRVEVNTVGRVYRF